MGMAPYTYIGFGAVIPRSELDPNLNLWDFEEQAYEEGQVVLIHGESEYVFVTHQDVYLSLPNQEHGDGGFDFRDITGYLGSTRLQADAIRAVVRRITTAHAEPMLKPYVFVTWY